MRLIDADLFMDNVRKELNCDERCCECIHNNLCVYKMVLNQPTAFDFKSAINQANDIRDEILNDTTYDNDIVNYYLQYVDLIIKIFESATNATNGKNGG